MTARRLGGRGLRAGARAGAARRPRRRVRLAAHGGAGAAVASDILKRAHGVNALSVVHKASAALALRGFAPIVGSFGERTVNGRNHSRGADRAAGARAVDRTRPPGPRPAPWPPPQGNRHYAPTPSTLGDETHSQRGRAAGRELPAVSPVPVPLPAPAAASKDDSVAAGTAPAPDTAAAPAAAPVPAPAAAHTRSEAPPPAAHAAQTGRIGQRGRQRRRRCVAGAARQLRQPQQRRATRAAGAGAGLHGERLAGQQRAAPVPGAGGAGTRSRRGHAAAGETAGGRPHRFDRAEVGRGTRDAFLRQPGRSLVQSAPRGADRGHERLQ